MNSACDPTRAWLITIHNPDFWDALTTGILLGVAFWNCVVTWLVRRWRRLS